MNSEASAYLEGVGWGIIAMGWVYIGGYTDLIWLISLCIALFLIMVAVIYEDD
jgi:hypothetical protein